MPASSNGAVKEYAPRPTLKQKCKDLEAEVADLKARLGCEPSTEETWGVHLSQELRDRMAARALVQEWGDEKRALRRLGFEVDMSRNAPRAEWQPLAQRIFGTDGVRTMLSHNLADLEANKGSMLARLMEIAQHGDDSNAVKAATQLSKVMGLNKADQGALPAGATLNIFAQYNQINGDPSRTRAAVYDADEIIDAEHFLTHEPGEATLIDDSEHE